LDSALRVIGLSHHTAPVALREKLAFRNEELAKATAGILAHGFHEAVILSTCNRVEIYAVASEAAASDSPARIRAFLSGYHGVPEQEFVGALYDRSGSDAIQHLFEVSASLDSQILGETEILAQAKDAYRISAECGSCGPALRAVFERAFFLSKELRADGGIGRTQASVSSAAVALAKKLFELDGRKVLVVGTGEMASGIVRALKSSGVADILVASRTEERAQEFARREGGRPCQMQQLAEHLASVDIVLVSSAAPHYIIGPKEIRAAAAKRRKRTLCLIDISVPRNVDPDVHQLDDTFLYDIDDLEEVAREGRREREAVAARWRPRLAEEAREKLRQLRDTEPQDMAKKLLEHAEAVRAELLLDLCRGLDPKSAEVVRRGLERLQGKLLHGPLETLRQAAREGGGADAAAWISRLFRLQGGEPESPPTGSPAGQMPSSQDTPSPVAREDRAAPGNAAPRKDGGGGEVAFAGS
jgi:glutamyl-tRNA reductase